MKLAWNSKQRETLSDFFKNIAVAWFTAAFTVPYIKFDWLTEIRFIVSMGFALYISLKFLED